MELKKIHEDKRGFIYLVEDLLKDNKEFSFLEIKKNLARGGCVHPNKEFFVVIKGKIKYINDENEKIFNEGESGLIPAGEPHAFVALEDSIVSEWGITTAEKIKDIKDIKLRGVVDKINLSQDS
jgi:mannose-6-phosphate isomerase-like protein (cupin superfamily)